jgi:phosphoadenosine phosphosulfate reductase
MAKIIRAGQVVEDNWNQIHLANGESPAEVTLQAGLHLFPLALWQSRKQEIISRYKRIGLWLDSDEAAESIADDLHYFQVIGVNFPKFADGRGFSTARLLRERLGYEGEVRALGDVLQDQLFYMKRCGFDSFAVRADRDIEAAVASLADFPDAYQAATDEPLPLFRRREPSSAPAGGGAPLVNVKGDAKLLAKVEAVRERLERIARDYSPAVFASSLGAEDMVLTDLILKSGLPIGIFSLDTGRLPAETYDLLARAEKHYGVKFTVYAPKHDAVEAYVREKGINGFYDSVENRKSCCQVRKVEPLKRALAGKAAWITGLRAQQATTRSGLPFQEFDQANGLEKFNPLSDWTEKDVWAYIRGNDVPYNELHDKFFPSIGCGPCTRAVTPGEDIRAGRWWWESADTKECGLHVKTAVGGASSQAK